MLDSWMKDFPSLVSGNQRCFVLDARGEFLYGFYLEEPEIFCSVMENLKTNSLEKHVRGGAYCV